MITKGKIVWPFIKNLSTSSLKKCVGDLEITVYICTVYVCGYWGLKGQDFLVFQWLILPPQSYFI